MGKDGTLTGFGDGLEIKEELLRIEGIVDVKR
ncbi:MAG TPA: MGMT family protein [Thermoanaerobacterales bacterium]|nr:MGMT family protein [Thermoanaerobacterales bacterium]